MRIHAASVPRKEMFPVWPLLPLDCCSKCTAESISVCVQSDECTCGSPWVVFIAWEGIDLWSAECFFFVKKSIFNHLDQNPWPPKTKRSQKKRKSSSSRRRMVHWSFCSWDSVWRIQRLEIVFKSLGCLIIFSCLFGLASNSTLRTIVVLRVTKLGPFVGFPCHFFLHTHTNESPSSIIRTIMFVFRQSLPKNCGRCLLIVMHISIELNDGPGFWRGGTSWASWNRFSRIWKKSWPLLGARAPLKCLCGWRAFWIIFRWFCWMLFAQEKKLKKISPQKKRNFKRVHMFEVNKKSIPLAKAFI